MLSTYNLKALAQFTSLVMQSKKHSPCIVRLINFSLIKLMEIQHECYIPADPLASLTCTWLGCSVPKVLRSLMDHKHAQDLNERVARVEPLRAVFTWVQKVIHIGNKLKDLALLSHPISSKTKTNHDSLADIFPRFASASYIWSELIGSLDYLCNLWLAGVITLVLIYDTQLKTALSC